MAAAGDTHLRRRFPCVHEELSRVQGQALRNFACISTSPGHMGGGGCVLTSQVLWQVISGATTVVCTNMCSRRRQLEALHVPRAPLLVRHPSASLERFQAPREAVGGAEVLRMLPQLVVAVVVVAFPVARHTSVQ